MAVIVSGTIAALTPILVPAINRVNGIMAIIKIINGTDRVILTKKPIGILSQRFSIA